MNYWFFKLENALIDKDFFFYIFCYFINLFPCGDIVYMQTINMFTKGEWTRKFLKKSKNWKTIIRIKLSLILLLWTVLVNPQLSKRTLNTNAAAAILRTHSTPVTVHLSRLITHKLKQKFRIYPPFLRWGCNLLLTVFHIHYID